MPDELLTPAQVSAENQIPEKTLANWRYEGRGPSFLKLEGLVRYRRSSVAAWRESCERGTPDAA